MLLWEYCSRLGSLTWNCWLKEYQYLDTVLSKPKGNLYSIFFTHMYEVVSSYVPLLNSENELCNGMIKDGEGTFEVTLLSSLFYK